ncbi:MAG: AsmA family protein [Gammaproteobacteria bacterium]|nr:AsmA family protein [Gammaproteobacteria bacterium]
MGKFITRTLITILVLLIMAGAFVATIPLWADMDQVKGYASDAVLDATGKELVLGGRLSFSLFPWLGMEAWDVSLRDPASGTLLAHTGRALVKIRLLALLRQRIEADTVSLDDLTVSIVRFADGTTNWDLPATADGASIGGPSLFSYTLAGIDIDDATLSIDDRMTDRQITLSDTRIATGVITASSPIRLSLSATAAGIPTMDRADLDFDARIHPGAPELRIDVDALGVALHQTDPQGVPAVLRAQASGTLVWNQDTRALRLQDQSLAVTGRAPALGLNRIDAGFDLREGRYFPDAKATAERVELTGQGSFGSPPVNTEFRLWGEVTAAPAAAQFALRDGGIALRRLAVESLRIVDAELSLEGDLDFDATNRQARLAIRATTATMDTRGPTATTTFTMGEGTLQANLHSGEMVLDVPEVAVSTTAPTLGLKRMEAILGGPIHGGPAALRVPRIQADLAFAATPGIPVTLDGTLALRGALELAGQRLRLEGLVSSFDLLETTRKLEATGSLACDVDIGLAGPRVTLSGLSARADVDAPPLSEAVAVALTGDLQADMAAQTLNAEGLAMQALGMEAKFSVRGEHIREGATWSGALVTNPFDPHALLPALGLTLPFLADPTAMKSLSIQGAFSATPTSAGVDTLDIRLDDSRIRGALDVTYGAPTRADFRLDIDHLDVDRYMPRIPGQDGETASAMEAGAAALPLLPRDVAITGDLAIGELKVQGIRTTRVEAALELARGVLRIAPVSARMYGGEVTQRIVLDTSGKIPRAGFAMDARTIDVGKLLVDLQGEARITGTGAVAVELESTGVDEVEMTASLNGQGGFDLRDGAIKGVNIARLLRQAEAAVRGKALPAGGSLETDFTTLAGSFSITNGRLRNDDLSGKSPLLRVHGRGTANLVTRRLDYRLDTSLVDTAEGQGGREVGELRDVTIPITFSGTFAEPTYSLDPGRLLKERARQAVKRKLEKQLQRKAGDRLEDQLKDRLLEGLLGK